MPQFTRADMLEKFHGMIERETRSSMERLPAEQALKKQTEAFKAITFKG